MCRLYGNTTILYKGLEYAQILVFRGVPGTNPLQMPRDNVLDFMKENPEQLIFSFVRRNEDLHGLHLSEERYQLADCF